MDWYQRRTAHLKHAPSAVNKEHMTTKSCHHVYCCCGICSGEASHVSQPLPRWRRGWYARLANSRVKRRVQLELPQFQSSFPPMMNSIYVSLSSIQQPSRRKSLLLVRLATTSKRLCQPFCRGIPSRDSLFDVVC